VLWSKAKRNNGRPKDQSRECKASLSRRIEFHATTRRCHWSALPVFMPPSRADGRLARCRIADADAHVPAGPVPMTPRTLRNPDYRGGTKAQTGPRIRTCKSGRTSSQVSAMLYLRPLKSPETGLQFREFDADYVGNLCAGDLATQEHFVSYFTELLQLKLRSRLRSPQAIEDVRQETFARVLNTLRKESGLRQPDRLGAFVNTVCNNVLLEHYRFSSRNQSLDEEGRPEPVATGADSLSIVSAAQLKTKVREILLGMPLRDRSLLKAVFLDERDRDEVCRQFGVDREYLRVLLFRAKQDFKTEYVKRMNLGLNAAQF
jgi:RNA polymerase sigma-70 factor (ECF subfamily)